MLFTLRKENIMNERIYSGAIERLRSTDRVSRLEVERVVENCLASKKIKSILDVGTGSGLFAEEFKKHGLDVSAIDPNPEMVEAAGSFVSGLNIQQASAEKIPFDNNSFDLVFMGLVLHEVNDYLQSIKELYRVAIKEVSILEWEYKEEDFGPPIGHRLESKFIEELAGKAGFKNVEIIKLTSLLLYKLYK
jgi:ubiquinone/menaquinone biosynthesis C-methylase UbiE